MEPTSKEEDEGRNGRGKDEGRRSGRDEGKGEEEDGSEGLCSCENSLKYGLASTKLYCLVTEAHRGK